MQHRAFNANLLGLMICALLFAIASPMEARSLVEAPAITPEIDALALEDPPPNAFMFGGGDGCGDGHAAVSVQPVVNVHCDGGPGRGDAATQVALPALQAAIFNGGGGRGDDSRSIVQEPVAHVRYAGGDGRGDALSAQGLFPQTLTFRARALLGGAHLVGSEVMSDALRSQGLIPLNEPYSDLGFDLPDGGGETIDPTTLAIQGSNAVVDWIVVELRDDEDPSQILAARCFLLQRNGAITGTDMTPDLHFNRTIGSYHVAIRHRNHLGVMTSNPVTLGYERPLIDMTLPATPTSGADARLIVGAVALLWPGDVSGDGQVKYTGEGNDRDPILQSIGGVVPTNLIDGAYTSADVNMDGQVKYTGEGNDRDPILQVIGGVVPTNVRNEQLP